MNNFFLVTSIDPTRTLTIRRKFVSAMRFQFASLMADIKRALVDQDVMGLDTTNRPLKFNVANVSPRQFDFPTSAQKVEAFAKWINEQAKKYLLSSGREGINISGPVSGEVDKARDSWIKTYIDSAYQQGIRRARQELKKKRVDIDDGSLGGNPIGVAFNSIVHADRVGLIYSRAFSSLKSITAEMDSVVSDVLALGIADGRGPKQIARMLDKVITGRGESLEILDSLGRKIPSLRRAEILARTEVIRSHHSANIGEYRAAGAMGITVLAEHLTAGDDRVCPKCAPLNGKQYTIEEAEYIIPVHPQCRCVAIPYIEDTPDIKEEKIEWKYIGDDRELERELGNKFKIDRIYGDAGKKQILEYGNKAGLYLTNMIKTRPGIKSFIESKGYIQGQTLDLINSKYVSPGVLGTYNRIKSTITVGSKFKKEGKLSLGRTSHSVDPGTSGTLRHEYAHFLKDRVLSIEQKKEWNKIWNDNGSGFFKTHISSYSSTNLDEAFAESFSAWTHSDYEKSTNKLPKEIEDYFDKVFS